MASIALDWALNNGMSQAQFDQRIFDAVLDAQQKGTSNAMLRIEMDRLGISSDDVARATGVTPQSVQEQYTAALPTTRAELIANAAADAELAARAAKDTTSTNFFKSSRALDATTSAGLLASDIDRTTAATAAAALAASQKAAIDKLAADNAAAAAATAAAAAAAKIASDKAAADAAAILASNATAAAKAAAAKIAADALAASNAAAAKATTDAAAAAAAKAATDAGLAAAKVAADKIAADAAAAKTASDKAAAEAAAIAASNATAAAKAAAAKAAADAKIASDAAAAKVTAATAAAKVASDAAAAKAAAAKAAAATTTTRSPAYAYALANGMTEQQYYKNIFDFYSKNSGLSDSMLRSEMDRLQISPQDVAAATGVTVESVLTRYNAAKATTPAEIAAQQKAQADLAARQKTDADNIAKAVADKAVADKAAADRIAQPPFGGALTLGQKFGSYESIPIGAQYNPAVTPGGASPYSLVMNQMTPFQNPYANFVPGTALGGYNPNLYNQIAVNNADAAAAAAAKAAADTKAANDALLMTGAAGGADGGGDGGGTSGDGGAGTGAGAGTGNAMARGGYVHGGLMFGPDPKGPDDGAVNLDIGEYVIRKSAVNKYGKGLLDMINEGKVPAKKIRSLLY